MRAWLLAARPKTLTASLVPVVVGSALAYRVRGEVDVAISLLALGAAIAIQIATNLFNDVLDFEKGTDTAERVGPTRVTQAGLIAPEHVRRAAWIAVAIAIALTVPLVFRGGWPIAVIAVASVACAYGYTGGPAPLAYVGLADVFVVVFFGLVAVGGVFYLQCGTYVADGNLAAAAPIAGLQIGLLATTLLAINNLRDVEGDATSGKRTLAVRFGARFARAEIVTLVVAPILLGAYWLAIGWTWAALLPILTALLGQSIVRGVHAHPPGPIYNAFLGKAAAMHLAFGILLTIGLVLA